MLLTLVTCGLTQSSNMTVRKPIAKICVGQWSQLVEAVCWPKSCAQGPAHPVYGTSCDPTWTARLTFVGLQISILIQCVLFLVRFDFYVSFYRRQVAVARGESCPVDLQIRFCCDVGEESSGRDAARRRAVSLSLGPGDSEKQDSSSP